MKDDWDDWGIYETFFHLIYIDHDGKHNHIGQLKIGQMNLKPHSSSECPKIGYRFPSLEVDSSFDKLPEDMFSLGQDESYYESINQLSELLDIDVYRDLNDVAFNNSILENVKNEQVLQSSLLRDVNINTVKSRFRQLAHRDAKLTDFNFSYTYPQQNENKYIKEKIRLDFKVDPASIPPSNVHVLIGRNGVGKTRCIKDIAEAIASNDNKYGLIKFEEEKFFAKMILISFSAFDDINISSTNENLIPLMNVSLRKVNNDKTTEIKTMDDLANEFINSLSKCTTSHKKLRWVEAINTLSSDPVFERINTSQWINDLEINSSDEDKARTRKKFKELSSGHKIVLLSITKMVELIDERTLLMIDEPENHLHPPLVSGFIRCISTLLRKRNGVAILATHSPIILQEVPRSCVWILHKDNELINVRRPAIETFGENLGVLTREIFGFEVTDAGFHNLIHEQASYSSSYGELLSTFNNQIGFEGRSIALSMLTNKSEN